MSWIKRNLYFLLGSFVTVGLLALAVVYLLQENSTNNRALDALDKAYAKLKRLYSLNPHPGTEKVNNIKIAQEQQKELRAFLLKAGERFVRIRAIPDSPTVTTEEFTAQLPRTIDQMQRDAVQGGVSLPSKYNFTFESIRPQVKFSTNSLQLLSAQLGEVKAVCDVLFRAKINSLDSLRRERVCPEDSPETSPSDYLERQSVTNELAVLTPYEITFRCFSSELAGVIGGFASSSNAFIVKNIDVEPAAPVTGPEAAPFGAAGATAGSPFVPPGGEFGASPAPRPAWAAPAAGTGAGTSRGALQTVINESVFKVSLRVEVVKLNLPK